MVGAPPRGGAIAGSRIQQYYGHALERLCEDGMDAILERLDIALADIVEMGPFFQQSRGQQEGLQIDWMILRRDRLDGALARAVVGRASLAVPAACGSRSGHPASAQSRPPVL